MKRKQSGASLLRVLTITAICGGIVVALGAFNIYLGIIAMLLMVGVHQSLLDD